MAYAIHGSNIDGGTWLSNWGGDNRFGWGPLAFAMTFTSPLVANTVLEQAQAAQAAQSLEDKTGHLEVRVVTDEQVAKSLAAVLKDEAAWVVQEAEHKTCPYCGHTPQPGHENGEH